MKHIRKHEPQANPSCENQGFLRGVEHDECDKHQDVDVGEECEDGWFHFLPFNLTVNPLFPHREHSPLMALNP
jgi:hypothetical protein